MSAQDGISPLEAWNDSLMAAFLSERAFIRNCGLVEAALATELNILGVIPDEARFEIVRAALYIDIEEVAHEELKTKHQIRALVNVIRRNVSPANRRFVHLGATSSDIQDTANAFRYKNFVLEVLVNLLPGDQSRLIEAATNLPGKMSGAVGTYAAFLLLTPHPRALEAGVLNKFGLRPRIPSTQIVQPDGWADLGHAAIMSIGRLAQRSALAKSLWMAMAPRVVTLYMDQISEHQRDLTNSASQRFTGEILAALYIAAKEVNP